MKHEAEAPTLEILEHKDTFLIKILRKYRWLLMKR